MAEIGAMSELVEVIGTTVLPGDLIIQVLLRLPALSILRFKSVCRIWLALFNLPTFIENHAHMALSSSKKNQQPSSFIVLSQFIHKTDDLFYFVRFPFLGEPVNLELPFEAKRMNIEVEGSTNGLVCLNLYRADKTIVLWNPATMEYNFIPNPELLGFDEESVSFGFAYDENTDCYKVVRILYYKSSPFKAEVYSKKTNVWTQVEVGNIPLLVDHISCSNVVSGCPYWFASVSDERSGATVDQVLMWFDASNDSFGFRRLPQCGSGYDSWSVKTGLGVDGDCPVAFGYSKSHVTKDSMSLTHKITKLKRNNETGEEDLMLDSSKMRRVVGFWRSDKIIALDVEWKLSIYDSHSAKLKSFPVWGDRTIGDIGVFGYNESLVSPSVVG